MTNFLLKTDDDDGLDETDDAGVSADWFRAKLVSLRPFLAARALTLCRDATAADDLVQETYKRALEAQRSFRPGTNLRAWLTTIMRNHFVDSWRRPGHDPCVDVEALAAAPAEEVSTLGPLDVLSQDDVWEAAQELSALDRRIFELAYFDGASHREIASRIPVRERTVATRLLRVRAKLRTRLQRLVSARLSPSASDCGGSAPAARPCRERTGAR